MSLQSVACFDLSDGDRAFLYWNTETQKFQLTSDQDQNFEECTFRDVRRTIYWAMGGNDPYTCDLPLVIHGLVRKHNELLHDGEPWEEYCSEEQCCELLEQDWGSYAANRIFMKFTVS